MTGDGPQRDRRELRRHHGRARRPRRRGPLERTMCRRIRSSLLNHSDVTVVRTPTSASRHLLGSIDRDASSRCVCRVMWSSDLRQGSRNNHSGRKSRARTASVSTPRRPTASSPLHHDQDETPCPAPPPCSSALPLRFPAPRRVARDGATAGVLTPRAAGRAARSVRGLARCRPRTCRSCRRRSSTRAATSRLCSGGFIRPLFDRSFLVRLVRKAPAQSRRATSSSLL